MWKTKYKACPVNARRHARARPRVFEGPDLQCPVVDALIMCSLTPEITVTFMPYHNSLRTNPTHQDLCITNVNVQDPVEFAECEGASCFRFVQDIY